MSRDEWKDRRGEEEDRMIKLLRGEASEGKNAQWFRNAKDWDVSTRPFVCLFGKGIRDDTEKISLLSRVRQSYSNHKPLKYEAAINIWVR